MTDADLDLAFLKNFKICKKLAFFREVLSHAKVYRSIPLIQLNIFGAMKNVAPVHPWQF